MPATPDELKPLLWEPKNLVRAIEAAGVTLWSWNVDTDAFAMDDNAHDLWGIPRGIDVSSRIFLRTSTPPTVTGYAPPSTPPAR